MALGIFDVSGNLFLEHSGAHGTFPGSVFCSSVSVKADDVFSKGLSAAWGFRLHVTYHKIDPP